MSLRLQVSKRSVIAAALLLAGWLEGAESSAHDELLKTVHKYLYTAREDAIRLLEDALQQDSPNVPRWVALVHALDVNGETYFAERASRLALKMHPDNPQLLPVAHALAARYDQALQTHAQQNFKQTRYGPFVCLGDCLLFKQQPRQAIASFNGQTPDDAALRRILAIAHARLGDYPAAEKLLGQTPIDDLLRLRCDLERGREADVKQRVPDVLARHRRRGQGSWSAPAYAASGGTVGEECRQAILWLGREFPDRRGEIYEAFGLADPQSAFRQRWLPAPDVRVSARRYIAWLRAEVPAAARGASRRDASHIGGVAGPSAAVLRRSGGARAERPGQREPA